MNPTIFKPRDLTKDEITQSALTELRAQGCRVRKVHNVGAFKKRRHQVEPGWPDIQGYSRTAVTILCEIKTIGDKFSPEQIERLDDLDKCGGISLVAFQHGFGVKVVPWKEAKIKYNIKS